jgi:hypothetical protein
MPLPDGANQGWYSDVALVVLGLAVAAVLLSLLQGARVKPAAGTMVLSTAIVLAAAALVIWLCLRANDQPSAGDPSPLRPVPLHHGARKPLRLSWEQIWQRFHKGSPIDRLRMIEFLSESASGFTEVTRGNIEPNSSREVMRLPQAAVLTVGADKYCYVRMNAGVEEREVVTGHSNGPFVELKKGVQEGERVLSDPQALMVQLAEYLNKTRGSPE